MSPGTDSPEGPRSDGGSRFDGVPETDGGPEGEDPSRGLGSGVADLHVHTTASDGTSTVEERFEQAADLDLEVFAVTDHDVVSDELQGAVSTRNGITCITGVEVRADCLDTKVEVLGYFVEPDAPRLVDVLEQARTYRVERNRALVENLNDAADLDLDHDELAAAVDGSLGRPHIAAALEETEVVDSIDEAFATYLSRDGAAYEEMDRLPAEEVLAAIHAAGGVASLAHPGRIRSSRVPDIVGRLADRGLDAIEVWYPYDTSGGPDPYSDLGVDGADALATEHDLLRTGGSDCHGPDSGKFRLGTIRVPATALESLAHRAGQTL